MEYALICNQTPRFTIGDCAAGHRADNRDKNRNVLIVPPDNFRPYVTSFQGNNCTDYINAVFVDGYTLQENTSSQNGLFQTRVQMFGHWFMITIVPPSLFFVIQHPQLVIRIHHFGQKTHVPKSMAKYSQWNICPTTISRIFDAGPSESTKRSFP